MEEYGPNAQVDAFLQIDDYYRLARKMGVGSARVFSLVKPERLSKDGRHFNFSQIEQALAVLKENQIEPMVVLGSNSIHRIPVWLRGNKPRENSIDMLRGLSMPAHKERLVSPL